MSSTIVTGETKDVFVALREAFEGADLTDGMKLKSHCDAIASLTVCLSVGRSSTPALRKT